MAASALTINAGAVIAPSIPKLYEHFHDVPHALLLSKLVLTITSLAVAICAPLAGLFADRVGRKMLLVVSLALCGIAGISGFYLDSLTHLLIGRIFLGAAVAGIMTATTTLIGDYFRGTSRNFIIGLQGAFLGLGGVVLLIAGGYLAGISWRWPFVLYAMSFLFLIPALVFVDEPDRSVSAEEAHAVLPHEQHTLFFVCILYGTAVLLQVAFYTVPVQLPFFLANLGIVHPGRAGEAMALLILCASITSLAYRRFKVYVSYALILSFSLFVMAIGFVLLAFATTYAYVLLAMAVAGAGLGLLYPNLTTWAMARTQPQLRGRIIGGLTMSYFLGQFLSPIITEPLNRAVGLGDAYLVVGGALLLGALPFGMYGLAQMRRALKRRNHEES